MADLDNGKSPPTHLPVWIAVGILGLALLFVGAPQTPDRAGYIFFGLGVSLLTAALVRIALAAVEGFSTGAWRAKHLQVFTVSRRTAGSEYTRENGRIKQRLQLMSVSAKGAVAELSSSGPLFRALVDRKAVVELLVCGPAAASAVDQPGGIALSPNDEETRLIYRHFSHLSQLYKTLVDQLSGKEHGRLEVRVIDSRLPVTIYHRDNDLLIYGHYTSRAKADESAALIVSKRWNPEIYGQLRDHLVAKWSQAVPMILLDSSEQRSIFDERLFAEHMRSAPPF